MKDILDNYHQEAYRKDRTLLLRVWERSIESPDVSPTGLHTHYGNEERIDIEMVWSHGSHGLVVYPTHPYSESPYRCSILTDISKTGRTREYFILDRRITTDINGVLDLLTDLYEGRMPQRRREI